MPLVHYGRDGRHAEREELFLSYKDVPDTIEVDGVTMVKVPATSAVFFKGAFSGGTTAANGLSHFGKELATPDEVRRHARGRRKEIEQESEKRIERHVEKHLADYNI